MWFYHVSLVVMTCILLLSFFSFPLGLHVSSHIPIVLWRLSTSLLSFSFGPLTSILFFLVFSLFVRIYPDLPSTPLFILSCSSPPSSYLLSSPLLPPSPLLRPVRYQRQQYSAWHPLQNRLWPNPALFHAGTSSKTVSREWWSSLCRSDKCSSACSPDLTMELDLQSGASPLPSDQTSPGRVCLFLRKLTLGVAWAAGGWSRAFVACWPWQSI